MNSEVNSWMRQTIQLISLSIVVFLGLVLTSIDKIEGMTSFSKQLTIGITLIYMFIFLLIAIDPNAIRIAIFGHFNPYTKLIILILIFLLTYLFLIPVLLYLIGVI